MLWGKFHTSGITLLDHTKHVVAAGEALFGSEDVPTRLGKCWLRFFKLPDTAWTSFYWNLLASELLHDWGKANDGMQRVLAGKGEHAIRHEHFSALLIGLPEVTAWLKGRPELDVPLVLSAVLTHHLKASGDDMKLHAFAIFQNGKDRFRSHHDDAEFHELAELCSKRMGLNSVLDLGGVPLLWNTAVVEPHRKRIKQQLNSFRKAMDENREQGDDYRRRLLHAVRSALIVADGAGSGLPRTGRSIVEWLKETFDEIGVWTDADVRSKVIAPRVKQIGVAFKWIEFQDDCADEQRVPARALLLAPCGSGKTLAAWRWIEQRAKTGVGHVLFLYPTRATATEGFRDYVSWAPEADVALMHGTSGFDLEKLFDNRADPRHGKTYKSDRQLFSMGFWGRRAFSATVDQFLAFMQYGYGPMCMLPVLADSVVVIDEVHSFDNKMFSALKAFLQEFNVPVLCMTATLPQNRRDELVDGCGLKPYEDRPGLLATIAGEKRYRLRRVRSQAEAEAAVRTALGQNKRVLWVVNQVKRAHAVVAKFVPGLPANGECSTVIDGKIIPVICYHSRFKLTDRVDRHTATMKALKAEPGPALGVTTQVCEMSLDIDVDLLVTEDCPVTALVQRMGRCNRAQSPRPLGTAGDVLVYDPGDPAPYMRKHGSDPLAGLDDFLKLVDGRELSQDDLEHAMREVDPPPSPGDALCTFLESGPYALAGEEDFRDIEEFNRPCLLPGDIGRYLAASRERQPGFVVPVPKSLVDYEADRSGLSGHLAVAQDGLYHKLVGFCDKRITEWGPS